MSSGAENISKSHSCIYCGNNPVPHFLNWYNESLSILLTPLRQAVLYNPLTRSVKKSGWGQKIALAFSALLKSLRIVRRQGNRGLCKVRRAQVLWEEAEKRGIKMQELLLFGKPFDTYMAEKGYRVQGTRRRISTLDPQSSALIFSGLPRPSGYHNSVLDVMDDKWYLKKLFIKLNLPVPAGAAVTSLRQARKIFNNIRKPVIVKPRTGSRGRHSTTFVHTEADLEKASRVAKQLCHWVMVEEQLSGPVYRATLVDFRLQGVLRGDSPQVTGDGRSTIGELIERKNREPHPGVSEIKTNNQVESFLSRQGLTLSSIPQKNQITNLTEKIGVNYGGSSSEDFDVCHPENKELFERAARAIGDPIVGFDFIIPDIARSYKDQRCGFIEANSLPFINLHHDPLLGKPRNVAAAVWDMLGW